MSGGPDSFALLLLAHAIVPDKIAVASVDHGLRKEAAGEVALVERVCAQLGVPFTALAVEVGAGNTQANARVARYAALADWASGAGLAAIATAHHADDQAETLLMRLSRGSGLAGLAGVRAETIVPGSDLPLLRPLLGWRRAELEQVVTAAGIDPVRDPSNEDEQYDRVRVRKHLAEHTWLDPLKLAISAQHLAEAERAIVWYAQEDWETQVHRQPSDEPEFLYYPNVPRIVAIETIKRLVGELGGQVSRSEAGRAFDRLWHGENASVGGVLAVPGSEQIEKTGLEVRVWRFACEPPRSRN